MGRVPLLASTLIVGCGTLPPAPDYRDAVVRIVEMPMATIAERVGPPAAQEEIEGDIWYVWEPNRSAYFGRAEFEKLWCRMEVHAASGRASLVQIHGNRGGCRPLVRRLVDVAVP